MSPFSPCSLGCASAPPPPIIEYTITMTFSSLQTTPTASFSLEELEKLTDRIQNAGTEVVNAKAGAVSRYNYYYSVAAHLGTNKVS